MKSKSLNNQILLIFGMPRSGTTWLGKIFDSHPDIIYLHEPDSEFRLKEVPLLVTPDWEPLIKEQLDPPQEASVNEIAVKRIKADKKSADIFFLAGSGTILAGFAQGIMALGFRKRTEKTRLSERPT